jgi:hypothetical protein
MPFEKVVLSLLLPMARSICRHLDLDRVDDIFCTKVLLGETLWRTQPAMRGAHLRDAFRMTDERFESVGYNLMTLFHGEINRFVNNSPFAKAAAAFSNSAISLVSAASHVVLDDVVVDYTSKVLFPTAKKNAHGPEFFAAAVPAPKAGASAVVWIKPRLWCAQQGPSTFEVVDEFTSMFYSQFDALSVADRPVFVADGRCHLSAHSIPLGTRRLST